MGSAWINLSSMLKDRISQSTYKPFTHQTLTREPRKQGIGQFDCQGPHANYTGKGLFTIDYNPSKAIILFAVRFISNKLYFIYGSFCNINFLIHQTPNLVSWMGKATMWVWMLMGVNFLGIQCFFCAIEASQFAQKAQSSHYTSD